MAGNGRGASSSSKSKLEGTGNIYLAGSTVLRDECQECPPLTWPVLQNFGLHGSGGGWATFVHGWV